MLSPFRPMLSPGHPTPFSVERVVVQQLNLVFGRSKPPQKESAKTGRKFLSYHRWIRSCLVVDEQIGEGFDVKRKSTLLRCRRSCRFNCDHFDCFTPKTLDIGKNCQEPRFLELGALAIFRYFRLPDSLPSIQVNIASATGPVRITPGAARRSPS
jgi:hypothetical protein